MQDAVFHRDQNEVWVVCRVPVLCKMLEGPDPFQFEKISATNALHQALVFPLYVVCQVCCRQAVADVRVESIALQLDGYHQLESRSPACTATPC